MYKNIFPLKEGDAMQHRDDARMDWYALKAWKYLDRGHSEDYNIFNSIETESEETE